jgi:hypothetical protein
MSVVHTNRREFVTCVASAAGVALVPMPSLVVAGPVASAVTGPKLADWNVDDVFGGYPRYCEAIGYGRAAELHGAADPLQDL